MKGKDIFKQLLPGVIAGIFLGMGLTYLVGVNTENAIPNYIGGAMCCLIPTFLNCLIVLKGTAKQLDRKISMKDTFLRTLPWMLLAGVIGLLIVAVGIEKVLHFDTRTIPLLTTMIYQTCMGIISSTLFAYIALKKYVADVKYTKRKK